MRIRQAREGVNALAFRSLASRDLFTLCGGAGNFTRK